MKLEKVEKEFALSLIEEAFANGASKEKSCKILGITIRSYQRWKEGKLEDLRKGPSIIAHKLSDVERKEVLGVLNSSEYRNLSVREVVPRLADQNVYIASESTFYRILKENKLQVHRGRSKQSNRYRPPAVIARGPNEVWSWDITYLKGPVRGEYFYLYMVVDIYSRMIVGWDLQKEQSSEHSSKLMSSLHARYGIRKKQLTLHADNGGPMKGATMLATLQKLGIIPSFSRPTVSDDNPFSEALFKTLKYCPQYPLRGEFASLEGARRWIEEFVFWYNEKHLHSEIHYVSPVDRFLGKDKQILEKRKEVYAKARSENPIRWKNKLRNWNHKSEVPLNHINKVKSIKTRPTKVMAMKIA